MASFHWEGDSQALSVDKQENDLGKVRQLIKVLSGKVLGGHLSLFLFGQLCETRWNMSFI